MERIRWHIRVKTCRDRAFISDKAESICRSVLNKVCHLKSWELKSLNIGLDKNTVDFEVVAGIRYSAWNIGKAFTSGTARKLLNKLHLENLPSVWRSDYEVLHCEVAE